MHNIKKIVLIGLVVIIGGVGVGTGVYAFTLLEKNPLLNIGIEGKTITDAYALVESGNFDKAIKILKQYPDDEACNILLQYINDSLIVQKLDVINTDNYITLMESSNYMINTYKKYDMDWLAEPLYKLRNDTFSKANIELSEMLTYIETLFDEEEYKLLNLIIHPFTQNGVNRDNGIDILKNIVYVINDVYSSDNKDILREIPYSYDGILREQVINYLTQVFGSEKEWEFAHKEYLEEEEEFKRIEANIAVYKEKQKEIEEAKPKIGMTANEVLASSWGNPDDINRTTTAYGVREQWCYTSGYGKQGYIYFEDGIVTTIQER